MHRSRQTKSQRCRQYGMKHPCESYETLQRPLSSVMITPNLESRPVCLRLVLLRQLQRSKQGKQRMWPKSLTPRWGDNRWKSNKQPRDRLHEKAWVPKHI